MVKFFLIFRGFFFKNSAKKNCKNFFNFPRIFFQKSREKKSREKNTPQKKSNSSSSCNFIFWTKLKNSPKIRNFGDVLISAKVKFAKKNYAKKFCEIFDNCCKIIKCTFYSQTLASTQPRGSPPKFGQFIKMCGSRSRGVRFFIRCDK